MYIPLEPVESSMISQVGYDEKKETLRIQFHDGATYDYPVFTPRDWKAFREADSLGKHFHRAIKPVFAYGRVEERSLKAPCCEHPGPDPTCNEDCYPCDPWCCPGADEDDVSALSLLAEVEQALGGALEIGLKHGLEEGEAEAFSEINTALHALRECLENDAKAVEDGPVPNGCSHGAGGRDCEQGCTCTCHGVTIDTCAHARREANQDGSVVVCANCNEDLTAQPKNDMAPLDACDEHPDGCPESGHDEEESNGS